MIDIYIFLIVLENEPPVGLDSIHVLSLSSRLYVIKCVESFETCYALKFLNLRFYISLNEYDK